MDVTTADLVTVVLTVLVGFGAGVLSALLGVGGAVITTPAVRVLGATPIQAVGSTVPAILPGAIAGTLRYSREGLVDWRAALGLGLSGSILAVVGALVSDVVGGGTLMVITAALMLWSGISVVLGGRRVQVGGSGSTPMVGSTPTVGLVAANRDGGLLGELFEGSEAFETDSALVESPDAGGDGSRRPLPLIVVLGAASGFVAGLLGVGGGIVMVPVLTGPLRIPMKSAVASSLVAVAIFSVPTLVTHALLGHIDWAYALPLMIGVVPGARVGAHLTVGASDRTIRTLFGVMIMVLAVVYGASEIAAL